jgi:hypothetical protein
MRHAFPTTSRRRRSARSPHGIASALLGAGALFAVPRASHAVGLIAGLGGLAGFGVDYLDYGDDGSTTAIDVTPAFPDGLDFYGTRYTTLYVNNNGSVSFNGPIGLFTPVRFPVAQQPMIAPFWGDVDTRGGGRPGRNGVYWDVRSKQIVVTWYNVGYYNAHDDRQNAFQLIIRDDVEQAEVRFEVEFRYNRCEWTTGDASGGHRGFGGTPAQAGFDAGNNRDYLLLPGSRTRAVLGLCRRSNVGEPGVWRFTISGGRPTRGRRAAP